MNQTILADVSELDLPEGEMCALRFLDDMSYEFVGGGEATNGY